MRDKKWLKEEVKSLFDKAYHLGKMEYYESEESIHRITDLIDQLDEPEITEEQAWNKIAESYPADARSLAVAFENFYYEGFSKKELPVIPKFIADWIEKYIDYGYDLYPALKRMENNSRSWTRVYEWYRENTFEFVIAYLTKEYEVEKEKLYTVDLPPFYELIKRLDRNTYELKRYSDSGLGDYANAFTEQEIKDYDKRFWAFAEEVVENV